MLRITLYVKNSAKQGEIFTQIKNEHAVLLGDFFEIKEEEKANYPTVSKSPMGAQEVQIASENVVALLNADSMIRMSIEGIVGTVAVNFAGILTKNAWKKLCEFFATNNKQKGNAWGAQVEIKRMLDNEKIQILHFFLDDIPKDKLFDALATMDERTAQFDSILQNEHLVQIKNIGFLFDKQDNTWKILGVEKFDGTVEKYGDLASLSSIKNTEV